MSNCFIAVPNNLDCCVTMSVCFFQHTLSFFSDIGTSSINMKAFNWWSNRWCNWKRWKRRIWPFDWSGDAISLFCWVFFFFSIVYLTLALNSPVKTYSLIHANKKIHINKTKYAMFFTCFHINFIKQLNF